MKLYVARNKQGQIGLYYKKPNWRKHALYQTEDWFDGEFACYLDSKEFPEVTFENSPQEVEIKLVK